MGKRKGGRAGGRGIVTGSGREGAGGFSRAGRQGSLSISPQQSCDHPEGHSDASVSQQHVRGVQLRQPILLFIDHSGTGPHSPCCVLKRSFMPLVEKYSIINFIIPSQRYVAPLLDHTVGLKGGGKKRRGRGGARWIKRRGISIMRGREEKVQYIPREIRVVVASSLL